MSSDSSLDVIMGDIWSGFTKDMEAAAHDMNVFISVYLEAFYAEQAALATWESEGGSCCDTESLYY